MPSERSPLLTIAIPTYNRSKHLGELLESLIPQLEHTPEVEIIISDNASSDNTVQVVSLYQQRSSVIKYIKNPVNIGSDANFLQCFEKSSGKYLWIFGDDDILLPGGLSKILSHLTVNEYDLIYLNSIAFDQDHPSKKALQPSKNPCTEYSDSIAFTCKVNIFLTFITGNIINKHRLSSINHPEFTSLIGTGLIQLGWTLALLNFHQKSLVINEQLIAARTNNTGGYGLFKVFGENLKTVTQTWLSRPELSRPILNSALQRFFPIYLRKTKAGDKNFISENPGEILEPIFGDNPRYWIFNYPLIFLPAYLGTVWFFGIRALNKIDKLTGSYSLR